MKKVLFIVYYFPPMGGSGVQRPLKFAKYLPAYGWEPIILAPQPGAYTQFDASLQKELEAMNLTTYRVAAHTPDQVAGKVVRNVKGIPDSIRRLLRRWMWNFYLPDNKKAWIRPAVERALEVIEKEHIDVIFSTAPPFSNHLIATELKKKTGVPVVLDYRDSWTHNHFMIDFKAWQNKYMIAMEKTCLQEANAIVGLDSFMLQKLSETHPDVDVHTTVIPHGYDPEDFEKTVHPTLAYKEGAFNLLYSGLFYESNQPDVLLESVSELISEGVLNIPVHLHFQGGLDQRIKGRIRSLNLEQFVTDYGYVTHEVAVANTKRTDAVWMLSNFDPSYQQIKSGKLFEYLGAGKPILALVHQGIETQVVTECQAGRVANPLEKKEVKEQLLSLITDWRANGFTISLNAHVERYNRVTLTGQLADLLTSISH
ncbi:MAG: glycosyltransferase [Bacteroidota bacterium]